MKIEILYIPGCPNYEPAVERLQKVLASESLSVDIERVPVNNAAEAKSLQFPGSPTIRVNGTDVESHLTHGIHQACRLYAYGSGVPSEEMLRLAISRADHGERS